MDDLTTLRSRERVVAVLSTRLYEYASTITSMYYKSGNDANFINNIEKGTGFAGVIEVRKINNE